MWMLNIAIWVLLFFTGFINGIYGQVTKHVEFTLTGKGKQELILNCPSTGSNLAWYRISNDGYTKELLAVNHLRVLIGINKYSSNFSSDLIINDLRTSDAGEYLCVYDTSTNRLFIGNRNMKTFAGRFILTVLKIAEFWESPRANTLSGRDMTVYARKCNQDFAGDLTCLKRVESDTKFVVGDTIMLYCDFSGRFAQYEWSREDNGIVRPIDDKNKHVFTASTTAYVVYRCTATTYLSDHTSISAKKNIVLRFHAKDGDIKVDPDIDSGTAALVAFAVLNFLLVLCLVIILTVHVVRARDKPNDG